MDDDRPTEKSPGASRGIFVTTKVRGKPWGMSPSSIQYRCSVFVPMRVLCQRAKPRTCDADLKRHIALQRQIRGTMSRGLRFSQGRVKGDGPLSFLRRSPEREHRAFSIEVSAPALSAPRSARAENRSQGHRKAGRTPALLQNSVVNVRTSRRLQFVPPETNQVVGGFPSMQEPLRQPPREPSRDCIGDLLTSVDRLLLEVRRGVPPEQELLQKIERLVMELRRQSAHSESAPR